MVVVVGDEIFSESAPLAPSFFSFFFFFPFDISG